MSCGNLTTTRNTRIEGLSIAGRRHVSLLLKLMPRIKANFTDGFSIVMQIFYIYIYFFALIWTLIMKLLQNFTQGGVVACAEIHSNLMVRNGFTAKLIFHWISILDENLLKWAYKTISLTIFPSHFKFDQNFVLLYYSIPGHQIATNFALGMAAMLSCGNVQNVVAITSSEFQWKQTEISI